MRLLLLLCGALAGCYDFDALGPPAAPDFSGVFIDDGGFGQPDDGGVGDGGPVACMTTDQCPRGQNCIDGSCRGAVTSCAAHKAAWPHAGDGLYWVAPGGVVHLAYCDMAIGAELCSDTAASHTGHTREGSL